jgi:hypothetical protein
MPKTNQYNPSSGVPYALSYGATATLLSKDTGLKFAGKATLRIGKAKAAVLSTSGSEFQLATAGDVATGEDRPRTAAFSSLLQDLFYSTHVVVIALPRTCCSLC